MQRIAAALFLILALAAPSSAQDIKVIAFDLFGTVFDLSAVDRQEVRDYISHVRQPEWSPLKLPESWANMPAHADSVTGIAKLRERFIVVTCSNAPLGLQAKMVKNAGIHVDAIIPLEMVPAYKPDLRTYQSVCDILGVEPHEVLMVTGNDRSPDLEYPLQIGMNVQRIRGDGGPATIVELAEKLINDQQQTPR